MKLEQKVKYINELYKTEAFQELILTEFITNGIQELVMTDNVDSKSVRAQLKARSILHQWMYGIIEEAEIAKSENKG